MHIDLKPRILIDSFLLVSLLYGEFINYYVQLMLKEFFCFLGLVLLRKKRKGLAVY